MVSIPPTLTELHISSPSCKSGSLSPANLSPGSNGSWDLSLKQLSDSLSQICHSPTSSPTPGFHGFMQKNGDNQHKCPGSPSSTTPRVVSSQSVDLHCQSISPPSNENKLAPSFFMKKNGRFCRKVRVRHEETKHKLHEQLAFLCRRGCANHTAGSHDQLDSAVKKANAMSSRPMLRRESIKMTYRSKVDLAETIAENVVVRLSETTCEVLVFDNGKQKQLHISDIPSDTHVDVDKVMCLAYGNELDIKEYPKKYISFDNAQLDNGQGHYIPVMTQDDQQGWWKLILHIPGVYDKPCLQVKTLDARLILSWSGEHAAIRKVIMELPHNVETRTVNGVISEDNQLIVEGRLTSGRERCFTY